MHSDWLLKLRMFFAIHFQATRVGLVPKILQSLQEYMSLNRLCVLYYLTS